MRVLVIGGSGYVGRLVLPLLAERFTLRVFDLAPPSDPSWEYVPGSVADPDALRTAAGGMEALLYMAMGRPTNAPIADYDVNVRGLHLALEAAHHAGARRAVYLSTLSVYDGHLSIVSGATDSEEVAPEPRSVYGFTKLLGEHVCRFIHRRYGLPVSILRLFLPVSQEKWHSEHRPGTVDCRTSAPDLARAIAAALTYEQDGVEVFHVTGDTTGRAYRHEKAKRLLGWEPLEGRQPRS